MTSPPSTQMLSRCRRKVLRDRDRASSSRRNGLKHSTIRRLGGTSRGSYAQLPGRRGGRAASAPPCGLGDNAARAEIRRILENAVDALPSEFRAVFMVIAMPISARQVEPVLHAIISPSMRTPTQSNIISPAVMVDLPWNVTAIDLPRSRRQYPGLTNYGCGMQVTISSLLDGAKQASGAVAIIDVFPAFTYHHGWLGR